MKKKRGSIIVVDLRDNRGGNFTTKAGVCRFLKISRSQYLKMSIKGVIRHRDYVVVEGIELIRGNQRGNVDNLKRWDLQA